MVTQAQSNLLTMRKLLVVAVAMFGFGFALVPFYQKICEVTGVNSLLKPDESRTQLDAARLVTIEFGRICAATCRTFRPLYHPQRARHRDVRDR